MNELDSSEAAARRANQPDPIVMYLIVRESLGMGMGKTAAQCAHASQMLQLKYDNFRQENEMSHLCGWEPDHDPSLIDSFKEWLDTSFRKVVLRADDKEWEKIKEEFSNRFVLVVDAGLTEIAPMSETVIGLWPMKRSLVPKVIKRLQVLK